MTKHEILPSGKTQPCNNSVYTLASIAGVLIAVLLSVVVMLLISTGTGIAGWAVFALGIWTGVCGLTAFFLIRFSQD